MFDNLKILTRINWGANEGRRSYYPKPKDDVIEYKPGSETEYQKKYKIAEDYLVQAFPKEFKINKVIYKNTTGGRLKRPISIKNDKSKIVIHHTAASFSGINTLQEQINEIVRIYKYHTFTKDRGDIGYNFLIGPDGTIFEGRAGGSSAVGAHATWNNTDSIGISLMGNFEVEKPTKDQINSLKKLIVALGQKYNINPREDVTYHSFNTQAKSPYIKNLTLDSLIGHKDVGNTSCPGKYLYELLPAIKRETASDLGYVKTVTVTQPTPKKLINTKIIRKKESISPKRN